MSQIQLLIAAVIGVFVVGVLIVADSDNKSEEEKAAEALVSGYANMTNMANMKCPKAIKKYTGDQVFFPKSTESDKQSYITLTWEGGKNDSFKNISCTFTVAIGGISELDIDGKKVISK